MSAEITIPWLGDDPAAPFPPTGNALERPNGLLAAGGDLSPERLLAAYRRGIFPWFSEGNPILWWSPAPRCVLYTSRVYLSRRTRRRFNSGRYTVTVDTAFTDVVKACAGPRANEPGTWITPDMVQAYLRLHELGHAHSLEVWKENELVGGIYGLSLGAIFFGESMFSDQTDGSKIALVALCRELERHGIGLMDCQVSNAHLLRMGAEEIPRERFEQELSACLREPDRFRIIPRGERPFERW
jgi:leucyl/phenylalanyl-tRNA--protein transferase